MAIHLRAARVNAGLSQTEAAKALNISRATLVSYEGYRSVPTIEMATKIADLYGLGIDEIIFFRQKVCFKQKN